MEHHKRKKGASHKKLTDFNYIEFIEENIKKRGEEQGFNTSGLNDIESIEKELEDVRNRIRYLEGERDKYKQANELEEENRQKVVAAEKIFDNKIREILLDSANRNWWYLLSDGSLPKSPSDIESLCNNNSWWNGIEKGNLTKEAINKLKNLRSNHERFKKSLPSFPNTYRWGTTEKNELSSLKKIQKKLLTLMKIIKKKEIEKKAQKREQEAKAEKERKQKEREIKAKAKIALYEGKSRKLASSLKNSLDTSHLCPYCGRNLGDTPVADHIFPISKGGLSSKRNMVMVCRDCNQRKHGLTLNQFIKKYNLDRDFIEGNLENSGKDF